jgi:glucose-1-phosphate thymidylyltransferase
LEAEMHILIPAGGRGVRLRPLTDYAPKPLLPLGDRPILTRIVERLPRHCRVTVLVSRALEPEFRCWQDTLNGQRRISLFVEEEHPGGPQGPVVALAECVERLGIRDDLLIMMGDSLLPFSLPRFIREAGSDPCLAAYRLEDIQEAVRFGVVEFGEDGRLRGFEEKPARPRSPWIFTGCLFVPARLLPLLHRIAAERPTQMGDLVARYLREGERIVVYPVRERWHDIGTFASYLEAHRAFLPPSQRRLLVSRKNHLEGVVYVHPTAQVSGSTLRNCIVLAGAEVRDAQLTGCVVHPSVSVIDRQISGKLISSEAEFPFGEGCLA